MAETQLTTGQPMTRSVLTKSPTSADRELRDRLGLGKSPARSGEQASWRSRILESVKTLGWVIVITVLLWVYAEREQLATRQVSVSIQAQSTDPASRIATIAGKPTQVLLDLSGPRRSIDEVADKLGASGFKLDVPISEDAPFSGEVSLLDRIGKSDILMRNAISVLRVSPASVQVSVDTKIGIPFKVRARPKDNVQGDAKFVPETVTVWGPKSVLEQLGDDQKFVDADMSSFSSRNKIGPQPDESVKLSVPLPDDSLVLDPPMVTAQVVLRALEVENIESIRVYAMLPVGALGSYDINTDETLANVPVTGPKQAIEELVAGKAEAYVVVQLKPDDLLKKEIIKELRPEDYRMPKGISVTGPPRQIKITVTERQLQP